MANHFKIPLLNPFKFIPHTDTPGIHFDDDWACQQIRSWELNATYKQKWIKAKTTKLQIESSIAPETLKVYNSSGVQVKTFTWSAVFTAVNYKIYECTFDISDLAEGIYFLYQRVTMGGIDWKSISEPIHSKASWPNTVTIKYKNSFNDFDIAFTAAGIEMYFTVDAAIMDFEPERDRTSYTNQTKDVATLKAVPSRSFKFHVGEAPGVAPWIIDMLNRIFCCDYISIESKQYQTAEGSKWDINRVKGYPLIGASIELVEAFNNQSLEFADTTPLAEGIVTAYEIETDFFGPSAIVPVTDIETQK